MYISSVQDSLLNDNPFSRPDPLLTRTEVAKFLLLIRLDDSAYFPDLLARWSTFLFTHACSPERSALDALFSSHFYWAALTRCHGQAGQLLRGHTEMRRVERASSPFLPLDPCARAHQFVRVHATRSRLHMQVDHMSDMTNLFWKHCGDACPTGPSQ